jgi:hypothetical protein
MRICMVGDEETATDFVQHPRYWNYFGMRGLKSVDESRFRRQISVELEDETRKEYEALIASRRLASASSTVRCRHIRTQNRPDKSRLICDGPWPIADLP